MRLMADIADEEGVAVADEDGVTICDEQGGDASGCRGSVGVMV